MRKLFRRLRTSSRTRAERITYSAMIVAAIALATAILFVLHHDPYVVITLDVTTIRLGLSDPPDKARALLDPGLELSDLAVSDVSVAAPIAPACDEMPAKGKFAWARRIDVSEPRPIELEVELLRSTTIEITRRRGVWIRFDVGHEPTEKTPGAFQASIHANPDHRVREATLGLPERWCKTVAFDPNDPPPPPLLLEASGTSPMIQLTVARPPQDELRIVNLDIPGAGQQQIHPLGADAQVLSAGDALILVEKSRAGGVPLLNGAQPLLLESVELYARAAGDYVPASYVDSGRIEFSGNPKRGRDILRPQLVEVEPAGPTEMAVLSLDLMPRGFRVKIAGRASGLRVGSDWASMEDLRPSLFQHIFDRGSTRDVAVAMLGALAALLAGWIQAESR